MNRDSDCSATTAPLQVTLMWIMSTLHTGNTHRRTGECGRRPPGITWCQQTCQEEALRIGSPVKEPWSGRVVADSGGGSGSSSGSTSGSCNERTRNSLLVRWVGSRRRLYHFRTSPTGGTLNMGVLYKLSVRNTQHPPPRKHNTEHV